METLKHIVLLLCTWLFRVLIFVALAVTAAVTIFGSPNRLEKSLVDVNAYKRFVPAVIAANSSNQTSSGLPLSDPAVQEIVAQAFPPQNLQIHTQTVINSFYDWLKGKTDQPTFTVDFSPNIDVLAVGLGNYAVKRLEALPICQQTPTDVDPFTASCQPKYWDSEAVRANVESSVRADGGILPKKQFTADDLPKDSQHRTLATRFSYAPFLYTGAISAPAILIGLIPLTALLIVGLSDHKRRTIQMLGYTILSSTIFLVLTPLIFSFATRHLTSSFQDTSKTTQKADIQAIETDVSNQLTSAFNGLVIRFGIIAGGVGVLVLLGERMTRPKSKYSNVPKRSGVVSSMAPRSKNGRFKLDPAKVPLQSSEISVTKKAKSRRSSKYRKIPKGEL